MDAQIEGTLPRAHESVVSIDLVRAAMRSEDFRDSLTLAELEEAEERYEKFLLLAKKHPERQLAPTRDIDLMWHLHMLHPRAYAADCYALFGDLLDHDGGFGSASDEVEPLKVAFAETAALWRDTYSEPYTGMVKCTRRCKSFCQRACKTQPPG